MAQVTKHTLSVEEADSCIRDCLSKNTSSSLNWTTRTYCISTTIKIGIGGEFTLYPSEPSVDPIQWLQLILIHSMKERKNILLLLSWTTRSVLPRFTPRPPQIGRPFLSQATGSVALPCSYGWWNRYSAALNPKLRSLLPPCFLATGRRHSIRGEGARTRGWRPGAA
jgi:hypothetical protein